MTTNYNSQENKFTIDTKDVVFTTHSGGVSRKRYNEKLKPMKRERDWKAETEEIARRAKEARKKDIIENHEKYEESIKEMNKTLKEMHTKLESQMVKREGETIPRFVNRINRAKNAYDKKVKSMRAARDLLKKEIEQALKGE